MAGLAGHLAVDRNRELDALQGVGKGHPDARLEVDAAHRDPPSGTGPSGSTEDVPEQVGQVDAVLGRVVAEGAGIERAVTRAAGRTELVVGAPFLGV